MDVAVLVLRLVLALVFAVAAVGKLLDVGGSRQAVRDFGVPDRFAGPIGVLLPAGEALIAVALLVQSVAVAAAVAAALLLGVFVAAIGRLLAKGEAPDCHCFGQIHSEPAGIATLGRNGVLAAAALVVAVAGPGASLATLEAAEVAVIALGVAVVGLAAYAWTLRAEVQELRRNRSAVVEGPDSGLPRGTPALDLEIFELDGTPRSLAPLLRTGKPSLLVQVGMFCGPCHELLPELARWRETLRKDLAIVIVSSGDIEANAAFAAGLGISGLFASGPSDVAGAYKSLSTPSATPLNARGEVAGPPVLGAVAIEGLVRSQLRRAGAPVPPSFSLTS
ncbi:MAG: hypothetical protein JWP18_2230 [Solirubrobacterales bacterium]|nr:hypothetical protein [Solirubrobacterales bacterium]